MISVRTEAQKRATSEAFAVSEGHHEDHKADISKGNNAINATRSHSGVQAPSSVEINYGARPKRPKLSRKIILQGVNGLDFPRNGSPVKTGNAQFSNSPYVKLRPLPSSMTAPLNKGQSVKLTEIVTDLERKEKDREIVCVSDNCIKIEPSTEEMILNDNSYNSNEEMELPDFFGPPWSNKECDQSPIKKFPNQVNNEVCKPTTNDKEKRNKRYGRASKDIDKNSEKHEMPGSVGGDDGSEKRRSRGVPRRHDDFVYDVEQMVASRMKVKVEPKEHLVPGTKGWKWAFRPKYVTGKRKLQNTKKKNKKGVKSAAKDMHSKKTQRNLHHKEVPVSPKDSEDTGSQRESICSPRMEVLQESNSTEPKGNGTCDNETSPRVSEIEEKPISPRKLKCKIPGRQHGSIGTFMKDDTCYIVVNRGTQRGANRLVAADGYTYNSTKSTSSGNLYWRCSFRPLNEPSCKVVVKKEGADYMKKHSHIHEPEADAFVKSLVSAKLKKKCLTDFLHSPREVVEQILKENEPLISQSGGQFNVSYLVRRFNRSRKQLKEKNPYITSVKFLKASPKDFLIEDIVFGRKRHMIFATRKQLQLLARSDRWYIDITLKFAKKPFTHLLSVSAYVQDDTKGDDRIKLKPLTFVLMSSLEVKDIVKVLRALLRHLRKPILVRSFVLDFFEPLWKGVRSLFFNCKLYGCAWKFGQCIWTKIQQLGIKDDQEGLYDEIHKLLKLPFVHPKKVSSTYEMLKSDFLSEPAFEDFIKYMEFTWLRGHVWKVSNWCVHGNPFRTKIEVIGWHYAVHIKYTSDFFEMLLNELHLIAASIPYCTRPAHQRTVQNHYMENENTPQGKIYKLWSHESSVGVYDFLSLCCELSEPTMEGMVEKMIEEFRKREECL